MKRVRLALMALVVAVVASGCIKADLGVEVKEDGSGTFTGLIAVNSQLASSFGGLGGDSTAGTVPQDFCKELLTDAQTDSDLPTGAKVEPYKSGDFCGVKISTPFANLDEAKRLLTSTDSGGSTGSTLDSVVLEKTNNGFRFSAKWVSDDSTSGADAEFAKTFLKGFSYIVRIKLPGGQVENNADKIEGDGTMVWNLDPLKSSTLTARTEIGKPVITDKVLTDAGKSVSSSSAAAGGDDDGGSSKTWLWIVLALVVVGGVVAFVLLRKNKAKGAPPAAAVAMGEPVGVGAPGGAYGAAPMSAPAAPAPPAAPMAAPMAAPTPVPPAPVPAPPAAPAAPAAPAPAAAAPSADGPQWDAARNAYIQYDAAGGRWMQYDQAAGVWKPIE